MWRSQSCDAASRRCLSHVSHTQEPKPNLFINRFRQTTITEQRKGTLAQPGSKLRSVAVKDNIAVSGLPTTCASGMLKEHHGPFQATVVSDLYSHGSLITGKTNMDEFGMGSHSQNSFFGPVQHVSVRTGTRSVGGSSGGSAQAVRTRASEVALGTDTGGSVRLPAAYSGTVGFKPSYGLISRWGVVPYANSLDTVGILSQDVEALQLHVPGLFRHDSKDPTSCSPRMRNSDGPRQRGEDKDEMNDDPLHVRIGVPVEYNIEELDPGVRKAWTNALQVLETQGCTIVPVSLPNTKHALAAYYILAPAEAASNLSKYDGVRYGSRLPTSDGSGDVLYSKIRGEGFGDEVKRRILLGTYTLSSSAIDNYFIKAQKIRRLVQQDFDRVFLSSNPLQDQRSFDLSEMHESIPLENKLGPSQVDIIICPTAPTTAPTIEEVSKQSEVGTYMNDVFTVPASLAGLPALSIPVSIPTELQSLGSPDFTGIQVIGQYGDDDTVIKIGRVLEKLLKALTGADGKMVKVAIDNIPADYSSSKRVRFVIGENREPCVERKLKHDLQLQEEEFHHGRSAPLVPDWAHGVVPTTNRRPHITSLYSREDPPLPKIARLRWSDHPLIRKLVVPDTTPSNLLPQDATQLHESRPSLVRKEYTYHLKEPSESTRRHQEHDYEREVVEDQKLDTALELWNLTLERNSSSQPQVDINHDYLAKDPISPQPEGLQSWTGSLRQIPLSNGVSQPVAQPSVKACDSASNETVVWKPVTLEYATPHIYDTTHLQPVDGNPLGSARATTSRLIPSKALQDPLQPKPEALNFWSSATHGRSSSRVDTSEPEVSAPKTAEEPKTASGSWLNWFK